MNAPRLEIDLGKIHHNARTLVTRLADRGITVTAITKATLGSPEIARLLMQAGACGLGDSRVENIETMRHANVSTSMMLTRSPMLSQVDRVVDCADISLNTEVEVIRKISAVSQRENRTHGVVLMVELGDLREGIMPRNLESVVRETLCLPNIVFRGLGTNLACRSGVSPGAANMAELSALAESIEATFGVSINIVSGGNSASIPWALSGADTGRINNLRMGESILLGREPLHRQPIDGLYTDAITVVAEVIESKLRPTQPWGELGQSAFGAMPLAEDRGDTWQTILAIGIQDTDTCGLADPPDIKIVGASSDHLIVESSHGRVPLGAEVTFQINYSALVRLMTSSFVTKVILPEIASDQTEATA